MTTPGHGNNITAGRRLLARKAQQYTDKALGALVGIIDSKDTPPAAVVAAAKEILDRGFGKPYASRDPAESEGGGAGLSDPDPDV